MDILLRNLSDEEIAGVDVRATRLGLSRSAYLRRLVRQDVAGSTVSMDDLADFADTFQDLTDPSVMSSAWE